MPPLQHKVVSPILYTKPTSLWHDTRPKPHVIAVDEAARIALTVYHTKVHRILGGGVGGWGGVLGWVWDARCWCTCLLVVRAVVVVGCLCVHIYCAHDIYQTV